MRRSGNAAEVRRFTLATRIGIDSNRFVSRGNEERAVANARHGANGFILLPWERDKNDDDDDDDEEQQQQQQQQQRSSRVGIYVQRERETVSFEQRRIRERVEFDTV